MARINYTLNEEQLAAIKQAMKHAKRPEVRQRATAIHLLHKGHRPGEVAKMMAVRQGTIYEWHQRWREGGVDGLANRPKSGRPGKADARYCKMLEEVLEQEPAELGYDFALWTVDRLRMHLEKETGVSLSAGRFRALLRKHDYVYRRPKHDLSELQDEEAREAAREFLDEVKKSPSLANLNSSLWTKQP
jgi:transposase